MLTQIEDKRKKKEEEKMIQDKLDRLEEIRLAKERERVMRDFEIEKEKQRKKEVKSSALFKYHDYIHLSLFI